MVYLCSLFCGGPTPGNSSALHIHIQSILFHALSRSTFSLSLNTLHVLSKAPKHKHMQVLVPICNSPTSESHISTEVSILHKDCILASMACTLYIYPLNTFTYVPSTVHILVCTLHKCSFLCQNNSVPTYTLQIRHHARHCAKQE